MLNTRGTLAAEEGVGLCGGVRQVPGVGVQIPSRGFQRLVPEDPLQHMQRDARIGEPGCSGVPQAVPSEVRQTEFRDHRIPLRGVANGSGREDASARPGEESLIRRATSGKTSEDRLEGLQDRDVSNLAPFGLLRDQPTGAGESLAPDRHDPLIPVHVADL